uniref:Homeodomain protein 2 n=1 Tax=Rhizopogon roseolus TaxID=90004 RepID=H1ADC5_9AGAM|nr:homeodomain protein 2 [Rhizopogon roseolus]
MTSIDSILKLIVQRVQECFPHSPISSSSHLLASQSIPQQHIASISLPDPPPIYPALMAAGARPEISQAIDQAYHKRATDLRALYHSAAALVCSNQAHHSTEFCSVSMQKVLSLFTKLYLRQLVIWRDDCVNLYLKHPSTGDKPRTSSCTPKFNHEYIPLLEHFFAENAFPTQADKAFLAKKSAMTYRQIHVWFQNRRNRMKKEGQVLKKKPAAEGAIRPLDTLYQRMEKFIVPRGKELHTPHSDTSGSTNSDNGNGDDETSSVTDGQCNPLDLPAPLHAFPSTYPPSCSYDPFPSRNGVTNFGTPGWLRRPINTPVRYAPFDIDGLINQFSQANILDDSSSRLRGKRDSFSAVAAITVIPPSAPHPALIRGVLTNILPVCNPLPSIPATASRRHVFHTPSPQSRPVTLMPTPETPTTQKTLRRKIAPLPRRVPHGNPISHRDVTPAISEASVSSPSRSSSFGSDSSSQSRLFLSVSSMSSTSSSLVTPPSSLPSPPVQLPSPSASFFNLSSSMIDLFGDALVDTPSPADGLQFDFSSSFLRNSHIQKSPTSDFSPPAANVVCTPS